MRGGPASRVQARDRIVDEVLDHDRRETSGGKSSFTTHCFCRDSFSHCPAPTFGMQVTPVWDLSRFLSWRLAPDHKAAEYFAHYTYKPKPIQASIMRGEELPEQPFSRGSAYAFLILGYAVSIGVGLFIGWHAQDFFNDIWLVNQPRPTTQSHLFLYSPVALFSRPYSAYPKSSFDS
jgi:hypothetical protein